MKLFSRVAGLNNKVDPVRLKYDPENGIADLSLATNIVIDDTGRPGRVKGHTLLTAGIFHSAYRCGGDAFVVQDRTSDAAIYQVASDFSLTGVRSGLTKGVRVAFQQVNNLTFYTNGTHNGVIEDSVSSAWPTQTYYGPTTDRDLTAPPAGKHLGFHQGRMVITEDNIAWFTEVFQFGLLDRARMFVQVKSDIRMVAPVNGGVFISDEDRTYFFSGSSPLDFREKIVADYPAHEWSLAHDEITAQALGLEMPPDTKCRLWSSADGVCVGLPDGSLLNLTNDRIKYANEMTDGASLIWDGSLGKQAIVSTFQG